MFAGVWVHSPGGGTVDSADVPEVSRRLSPYSRPDREGLWESETAWLLSQVTFNTPESKREETPVRCPRTGAVLAFWGRLDNRGELAKELGISTESLAATTDGQLALAAWQRWDESLPERLAGDFALAVLDPARRRAFLARDAFGVKPLFYVLNQRLLAFASTAAALRAMKALTLTADADWMARHIVHLSMSNTATAYSEVLKLPPGHCLGVAADGSARLRRWLHWHDDPPPAKRRDARRVEEFRARLEEAVRCRMRSDFPLGTENSGGLDSGSITAYLAHLLGEPGDRLHCFGFALSEQESEFILEVSRARRIVHNYLIPARPGAEEEEAMSERALHVLGYPDEHNIGSSHIPIYRECEQRGIRTLFSGFGGDEIVTNPGHLLRWELLDGHRYGQLWQIMRGNLLTRSLRTVKAALIGRGKPAHNALFRKGYIARWQHQLLRGDVVERLGLYAAHMEDARHDAPYRRINDFILHRLAVAPYVATRLECCTLLAASYGVEYRWPLWDTRLVQQYLSTPSLDKFGPRGIGRYLYRRAVDSVTPARVAWNPDKSMGNHSLYSQLATTGAQACARQAREDEASLHPLLAELLDRDKLRRQIAQIAKGNPGPELVFVFRRSARAIHRLNRWLHEAQAA